jgi:hypothetical protein
MKEDELYDFQPIDPYAADRAARRAAFTEAKAQEALRALTPAETRTGVSDRTAAALNEVAVVKHWLYDHGVTAATNPALIALDRIEQALRHDDRAEQCRQCGVRPGKSRIDPYAQEIEGRTVRVFICDACMHEREMDI